MKIYVVLCLVVLLVSIEPAYRILLKWKIEKAAADYRQYKKEDALEMRLYYANAKLSKTQYDVMVYINQLPHLKQSFIETFGSERNWDNHLLWLKEHGAMSVTIDANRIPYYISCERSPYQPLAGK